MRSTPLLAGAALAAALTAPSARAQEVTLRFAPPVGQVTHYRTVTQTWMQVPGMSSGDTSVPASAQTLYATRTITAMEGAARLVTTVVDSSRSEAPGMPAMAAMMGNQDLLRGLTTHQKIDPLGRVLSSEVTPPGGMPPEFAQRLGQSAVRRGPIMPEAALKPGDTWTDTLTTGTPGGRGTPSERRIVVTLRLERVEQRGGVRVAVISMNGTVHGDTAGAGGSGLVSGTMTGEFDVDLEAGRAVRTVSELNAVALSPRGTLPIRVRSVTETQP